MSSLALRNISKIYPNNNCVVKNFNLEIQDQEFIIFVGPSGCGKSTTCLLYTSYGPGAEAGGDHDSLRKYSPGF